MSRNHTEETDTSKQKKENSIVRNEAMNAVISDIILFCSQVASIETSGVRVSLTAPTESVFIEVPAHTV